MATKLAEQNCNDDKQSIVSTKPSLKIQRNNALANRLRQFIEKTLSTVPWQIVITDWTGQVYNAGQGRRHWRDEPLRVTIKTERAGKTLLNYNALGFLERFLEGEVDLEGNLFILSDIQIFANLGLKTIQMIPRILLNLSFQNISRAKVNVKSHYDIPQEILNTYLDKVYMSYSCGMFKNPYNKSPEELLRIGKGQEDTEDTLEKAQWRKFKDAVDYINPKEGETLLDVGCGYGGQLLVALENHPFGKVVGWTHSNNQVAEGTKKLSKFDSARWELNEGDYRLDNRVFDHITSTGMISHVGPRGLKPYVKNVRKRIKRGGRYVHHALMLPIVHNRLPLNLQIGAVFNKKYVWPGFHWFTLGTHIKTLERNGFEIEKVVNLSPHYGKTTAAWYERMMANKEIFIKNLGEPTLRAWQIYLGGVAGEFVNKSLHVYRLYCEAV